MDVDDIRCDAIEDHFEGVCSLGILAVSQLEAREAAIEQRLVGRRATIGGRGVSQETLMSSSAEPFDGISNILFDATEEPTFFVDEEDSHG